MKGFLCSLSIVFAIFILLFSLHSVQGAPLGTPSASATPTEAPGGVLGALPNVLRCPVNLSGVGPTWKTIEIGVSTLQDLGILYTSYAAPTLTTPAPPLEVTYDPNIKYAQNYEINIDTRYTPQPKQKLPIPLQVCVVNGKIAAMMFPVDNSFDGPKTIWQWVSFLGKPKFISWFTLEPDARILHWPEDGTSVAVVDGARATWIYYYPFRNSDNENLWPANSLITTTSLPVGQAIGEMNLWDFSQIQTDIPSHATDYSWPTRTPSSEIFSTQNPKN